MPDNRERDQGLRQGTGRQGMGQPAGGQHAPSRNPQGDRSAGGQGGKQIDFGKKGNLGGQQGGIKKGDGGRYKEGGQNEQVTQR